MAPADRERIEAIRGLLRDERRVSWLDVEWLLSQLSALTEALAAAREEIAALRAKERI